MIKKTLRATIKSVDGDEYDMMFGSFHELDIWMLANRGKYSGIGVKIMEGGVEHDNDGADLRITRSGNRGRTWDAEQPDE